MLLLSKINSYIIHPFSTYVYIYIYIYIFFHINFPTYCYTFSNFFPPFYIFIFLLLSTLVTVWILCLRSTSSVSRFFFLRRALIEFQWVSCTVHEIHKSLFLTKLSLKMDPTALFTHSKIILLQCFQFSAK